MVSVALVLHGRIGSWLVSATELPGAQRNLSSYRDAREAKAAAKFELTSRLAAVRAFAAFTHSSLWQHVVVANRNAGASVRVVIHSWSPEVGDVLDGVLVQAQLPQVPVLGQRAAWDEVDDVVLEPQPLQARAAAVR